MKKIFVLVVVSMTFVACASGPSRIKEVLSGNEAVVSLADDIMVQPGQKLNLYERKCHEKPGSSRSMGVTKTVCNDNLVGEVKVIRASSNKEVVVSKVGEFSIEPGMIVE